MLRRFSTELKRIMSKLHAGDSIRDLTRSIHFVCLRLTSFQDWSKMSAVNQLPYATSSEVSYRICVSLQDGLFDLEDPVTWNGGQIKDEYPKFGGAVGRLADLFVASLLGYPAPNMSLVIEPLTGCLGNASPSGCYGSIYRNESDFTPMPVEYPVLDYNRIDPIQVMYEGPLKIMSMYMVDEKVPLTLALIEVRTVDWESLMKHASCLILQHVSTNWCSSQKCVST